MLGDITISNGLAWSADGATMYYIDSTTRRVDAWDYDLGEGTMSNRRPVVEIPAAEGLPDGMTIDAEGCLWVACWGGGAVRRSHPTVRLTGCSSCRCPQVTSCAFAGAALDRLVITTARLGLDASDRLAGATFVVDPGVQGTPTVPFGG